MTDIVSFSLGGFEAGAPIDPITGSFKITFDAAVSHVNVAGVTVVTPFNFNVDSELQYNYDPTPLDGILTIGGALNFTGGVSAGTNDFALQISHLNTTPVVSIGFYSQAGEPTNYDADISVSSVSVSSTPIPRSLPLLASGLLALAGLATRKRPSADLLGEVHPFRHERPEAA